MAFRSVSSSPAPSLRSNYSEGCSPNADHRPVTQGLLAEDGSRCCDGEVQASDASYSESSQIALTVATRGSVIVVISAVLFIGKFAECHFVCSGTDRVLGGRGPGSPSQASFAGAALWCQ